MAPKIIPVPGGTKKVDPIIPVPGGNTYIDPFKDTVYENNTLYKTNINNTPPDEQVFGFDGTLQPKSKFALSLATMPRARRAFWQKKLKSFGIPLSVTDGGYDVTGDFEKYLVGYAEANTLRNYATYQQAPDKKKFSVTSIDSFIDEYAGSGKGAGGPQKSIVYDAPFTAGEAKAWSDEVASKLLGRKATDAQSTLVLNAINTLIKNKPNTTTTTISGNTATTKKTTGITQEDKYAAAESILKKSPEYKPYQIATTYYDALIKSMDNPSVSF
jgi:hypothetical protein